MDKDIEDLLAEGYDPWQDAIIDGNLSLEFGYDYYNEGLAMHHVAAFEKARRYYELSVELGNMQAAANLGYLYAQGRMGTPDPEKAFALFSQAAASGHAEACFALGDLYASGRFCTRDDHLAFRCYMRSAELSSDDPCEWGNAVYRLAECYENGRGCAVNPSRARAAYREAERGLSEAVETGFEYYRGSLLKARAAIARLSSPHAGARR